MKSVSGFTLIEVLIASTLGLVLITTAAELLVSARDWQRSEQHYSKRIEDIRLLSTLLRRAVRSAGDPGCHWQWQTNLTKTPRLSAQPAIANPINAAIDSESDVLVIQRWQPTGKAMMTAAVSESAVISLDRDHNRRFGHPVLLSADAGASCVLFNQAGEAPKDLNRGPGWASDASTTSASALNHVPEDGYQALAGVLTLYEPERVAFYIDDSVAGSSSSLFRRRLSAGNRREELLVGINAMQLAYAVDPDRDGDMDAWVSATNVGNWQQVTAVRVRVQLAAAASPGDGWIVITQALRNGLPHD